MEGPSIEISNGPTDEDAIFHDIVVPDSDGEEERITLQHGIPWIYEDDEDYIEFLFFHRLVSGHFKSKKQQEEQNQPEQ